METNEIYSLWYVTQYTETAKQVMMATITISGDITTRKHNISR
jgi:hypothetical protein